MGSTAAKRSLLVAALLSLTACTGGPTDNANPDPVLARVLPAILPAQAASVTLELEGQDFSRSSRVRYGGENHEPRFLDATRLELTLSRDAVLAPPGSAVSVRVITPSPGGGFSAAVAVRRDFGIPVVAPGQSPVLVREDTARTFTITGDNFTPHTLVYIWSEPREHAPEVYHYHQVAVVSATKESIVARVRGWNSIFFGPYYLHVMNPDSVRSNSVLLH